MSKLKKFLFFFIAVAFMFGFSSFDAKANVIPGTNFEIISRLSLLDKTTNELYEFQSEEVLNAFLEQQKGGISLRSYVPRETRHVLNRTYEKVHTSNHLIRTVGGGRYGGTMSLNHGISISVDGVSSSTGSGASYPVPKNQKGNIVLKTKIKYSEYRIETRINMGYNKHTDWTYAGTYTKKKFLSNWYHPVYW